MLTHSEQNILEDICRNSKTAILDIHTILGKVYDDELALDLNRQAARYSRMQEKAVDKLLEKGVMPQPIGILERTKRWAAIQAETALNVSTPHVADMMLRANEERVERMHHTVEENPVTDNATCELAEEFLDFEEENLHILKTYL